MKKSLLVLLLFVYQSIINGSFGIRCCEFFELKMLKPFGLQSSLLDIYQESGCDFALSMLERNAIHYKDDIDQTCYLGYSRNHTLFTRACLCHPRLAIKMLELHSILKFNINHEVISSTGNHTGFMLACNHNPDVALYMIENYDIAPFDINARGGLGKDTALMMVISRLYFLLDPHRTPYLQLISEILKNKDLLRLNIFVENDYGENIYYKLYRIFRASYDITSRPEGLTRSECVKYICMILHKVRSEIECCSKANFHKFSYAYIEDVLPLRFLRVLPKDITNVDPAFFVIEDDEVKLLFSGKQYLVWRNVLYKAYNRFVQEANPEELINLFVYIPKMIEYFIGEHRKFCVDERYTDARFIMNQIPVFSESDIQYCIESEYDVLGELEHLSYTFFRSHAHTQALLGFLLTFDMSDEKKAILQKYMTYFQNTISKRKKNFDEKLLLKNWSEHERLQSLGCALFRDALIHHDVEKIEKCIDNGCIDFSNENEQENVWLALGLIELFVPEIFHKCLDKMPKCISKLLYKDLDPSGELFLQQLLSRCFNRESFFPCSHYQSELLLDQSFRGAYTSQKDEDRAAAALGYPIDPKYICTK